MISQQDKLPGILGAVGTWRGLTFINLPTLLYLKYKCLASCQYDYFWSPIANFMVMMFKGWK